MLVFGHKGGSMRAFSGASLVSAAMLALSISVGCAQVGQVQAKRSFKAANAAYQAQDYKKAADPVRGDAQGRPEPQQSPTSSSATAYDNQYKPSKQGDPANEALLTSAVENYQTCAEKLGGSDTRRREEAGEALARVPGRRLRRRQAERPGEGRTGRSSR